MTLASSADKAKALNPKSTILTQGKLHCTQLLFTAIQV